MAFVEDTQPEIKFRWCRTVRCRAQEVYLVLTSVTGTKIKLEWQADLGWYESAPSPVPCGFHSGFILIKERIRDFIKNTLETREKDYKVDPFHIVPHKFAVELFLESDEATSFWSEAPELRLRYLSSEHLERLGTSSQKVPYSESSSKQVFPSRKWVSSTSLNVRSEQDRQEPSPLDLSSVYQAPEDLALRHSGNLGRGKSHSFLSESSTSAGGLQAQGKSSTSYPNLSRAFQVAVDLSRASSRFLAGVSSTSSGVFLGYEDGSDPPSLETGNNIHTDSAYAAGGETSQESESGEGAKRRKKSYFGRGHSLQIDDLATEESWRPQRERAKGRLYLSNAPSSSFEDLLGSISAGRRAAVKSELNYMKFETLERERLVQEILQPSDSDFEDEEAPCEVSNPDSQGPYRCVITFESRSTSMEDVGSPRALEDVLVSLTSNESHPESSQPQPLPRTVLQLDLLSDESALTTSVHDGDDKKPIPKPRTLTPVSHKEAESDYKDIPSEEGKASSLEVAELLIGLADVDDKESSEDQDLPEKPEISKESASDSIIPEIITEPQAGEEGAGDGELLDVTDSMIRVSDTEDDNFQYDSLKHDDHENLPIDIRNLDSEESLGVLTPKVQGDGIYLKGETSGEDATDSDEDEDDESEEKGLYTVEGAETTFSSRDGEVPTDEVTLVPIDSFKGTVREVKNIIYTIQSEVTGKEENISSAELKTNEVYDDGVMITTLNDTSDKESTIGDSECVDNEESDRSESEALFNITDVSSRKFSVESEKAQDELEDRVLLKHSPLSNETKTQAAENDQKELRTQMAEGESSFSSRHGFNEQKMVTDGQGKDSLIQLIGRHTKRRSQACGTNGFLDEDRDLENRRPYIRQPKVLNTGTQTAIVKQISRTTSVDIKKSSDSDTCSSKDRHPSKFTRSPLRNRTNGQAESFTPLPDRLSGPWSQRLSASVSSQRSGSPGTFIKSDLTMLQRNLYNLVQEDEAAQLLQNSVHSQKLRGHQHGQLPSYWNKPHTRNHGIHTTDRPPTPEPPLSRHASPEHQYYNRHLSQTVDHNHYHHSPLRQSPQRHIPQPTYYSQSPLYQYKYPVLSTSVINTTTPSRTSLASGIRSDPVSKKYSGSVTDLRRLPQRTKYNDFTSSRGNADDVVRPASSLPDLRQTPASTAYPPHQASTSTPSATYSHLQQGPKHAHSAYDIMVGGYSTRGKRVSWREWHMDEDSDSGGSTDSLIDEADHVTTASRVDLTHPDFDGRYRKRHRGRRRRTRSHHGFNTWRDDSDLGRGELGNRPYLPYRGDQLCPGQQVKVLAPGGGVAVARVVTNQRSAFLTGSRDQYPTSGIISPASVTVILLSEPNRLQGTVVTVPLEKVLLAWPRA